MGTVVISGFPGIGKSAFAEKLQKNGISVWDCDSSQFPKDDFPNNYIEHIKKGIAENISYILVSTHSEVRDRLGKESIPFVLIFPPKSAKDIYIQRYIDRGSPTEFVDMMRDKWENFLNSCYEEKGLHLVVSTILPNDKFLSDIGLGI